MIFSLIKILIFFIIIYFVYTIINTLLVVRKNIKDNVRGRGNIRGDGFDRKEYVQRNRNSKDKTIELDEDQYKVE